MQRQMIKFLSVRDVSCSEVGLLRADVWRKYCALDTELGVFCEEDGCYGYLYLTSNKITKQKYIGQKKGRFERSYYGSGTHLKHAIKKYGVDSFCVEPVVYCSTPELLDWCETEAISLRLAVTSKDYYNLAFGGQTPRHTLLTKTKIADSMSGENNHQYGIKHSSERRKKVSGDNNPMYGRRGSKSHMFGVTGNDHPAYGKASNAGEKNPMHGKTHTDEAREKMRKAAITMAHTSRKGIKHPRVTCPGCGGEMAKSTFTRYHAGKCTQQ